MDRSVTILWIFTASIFSIHGSESESFIRPESRVIGGSFAKAGEFPHQAMMLISVGPPNKNGQKSFKLCGASILNPDYILSAGHCVASTDVTDLKIVAGLYDISQRTKLDELAADKIIIHPCYDQVNAGQKNYHFNDIAMIKLAQPLSLNEKTIKTIKIDENDLGQDGEETIGIGWGKTDSTNPNQAKSDILKKVSLKVTTTECKQGVIPFMNVKGQICTSNKASFICQGDSGGPLLCDDGSGANTNVVCGVVSLATSVDPGKKICLGPSIYTRVYHYRDWIKKILAGEGNSEEGCLGGSLQQVVKVTTAPGESVPDETEDKESETESNESGSQNSGSSSFPFVFAIFTALVFSITSLEGKIL